MTDADAAETHVQRSDFGLRLSRSMQQYGPLCVSIDPHRRILTDWGYNVDAEGAELFSMRMLQATNGRVAAVPRGSLRLSGCCMRPVRWG